MWDVVPRVARRGAAVALRRAFVRGVDPPADATLVDVGIGRDDGWFRVREFRD
jgi:hypothetical protein